VKMKTEKQELSLRQPCLRKAGIKNQEINFL
jgi:hypothetical protein